MSLKKRISSPRLVNLFILLCVVYTDISYQYWKNNNYIIENDVIQYYAYLPAVFIYHDPTFSFINKVPPDVGLKIWFLTSPTGKPVLKYSCGLSILYSPFFFAAHLIAKAAGYRANGYSPPYRAGIIVAGLFYLLLGLYYLRKTLSMFFSDAIVAITSFVIVMGTNLFYYTTSEPGMEHVYGFCMFAAFMYYTIQWHKHPSFTRSLIIGGLSGLITLARPTNILIVIFFILWDIKSFDDLKEKILFFIKNHLWLILIGLTAFCIWIPQFIYWKNQTGHWLYYSYGNKEQFFFGHPHIIDGLFSYRKGWLLYTPVMTFALIGVVLLQKHIKQFFIPILIFTLLNIYITFSWWCWWYGGSFGLRALIDSYALLAVPLAAFISYTLKQRKLIRLTIITILFLLVFLNQFQTQQYRYMAINWDSMTKAAYWGNFGRLHPVPGLKKLLNHPDYKKARLGVSEETRN